MVWLSFPGMTSSLANHRCTLSYVFSTYSYFWRSSIFTYISL